MSGSGLKPKIRVHVGPMYAGKTNVLYNVAAQLLRAREYGQAISFAFVRPSRDTREDNPLEVRSHDGRVLSGVEAVIVPADAPEFMLTHSVITSAEVIIIDETQFFHDDLWKTVLRLFLGGKQVILAGLDTDHLGRPFPATTGVVMLPDAKVYKLHQAVCAFCGNGARYSLRLVDGKPAPRDSPRFMVEHREAEYKPVCPACFMAKQKEVGNRVF